MEEGHTLEDNVEDRCERCKATELDARDDADDQRQEELKETTEETAAASSEEAKDGANLNEDSAEDLNLDEEENVCEGTEDELMKFL